MKTKELKNLAGKIAKAEKIIQSSSDEKEILKAKNLICEYSGHVSSMNDMMILDDMIQEILKKS